MRKSMLLLTTTAAIIACGAIAASAQAPVAQTPSTQQSPTTPPTSCPVTQKVRDRLLQGLRDRAQGGEDEDSADREGCHRYHGAMMGMMGRGMMGRGLMMRLIFNLMDADNDGAVSLQEFQAASERAITPWSWLATKCCWK